MTAFHLFSLRGCKLVYTDVLCLLQALIAVKQKWPNFGSEFILACTLPVSPLRKNMHALMGSPLREHLKDSTLLKNTCLVDGKWRSASAQVLFDVRDPASGEKICSMPDMDANDAQEALLAAAHAFQTFRTISAASRGALLREWYRLILANSEDLAQILTWENGKTLESALQEVKYAASFILWFSEEAPRLYGDTIPSPSPGQLSLTYKVPIGVCALITPWNFPAAMVTRKVAPALAAGCTVVVKAPSKTPITSLAFAELGQRAGFPAGVLNVVTTCCHREEVGALLTSSPIVRKVSFTGSTTVGKALMQQSAGTLKKLSLELGGNAPFLVFEDANLRAAVDGAIACKFRCSGQTCISANRFYVQTSIYDEFASALTRAVQNLRVGPGYESEVDMGPLIDEKAVQKCVDHVEDAVSKGATILTGGKALTDQGPNFFQPTVLKGMTHDMRIAREETFGPVAALFAFDTDEEALTSANATEYGLAAYIYTQNLKRAHAVMDGLEAGMIGVNVATISNVAMPFGGVKHSGFGREGSKYGMEEFTVVKACTLDPTL